MLLRLHKGIRALDIAIEVLRVAFRTEIEGIVLVSFVAADHSEIRCFPVVAQTVIFEIRDIRGKPRLDTRLVAIYRHDVALASVNAELHLAHGTRISAEENVAVGEDGIHFRRAAFYVEFHGRRLCCLLRDDVDDTADGVRAVLRACRALDDLDALDVLCAETHDFVRRAIILREVAHDRLTVYEDQRVARLCAAD